MSFHVVSTCHSSVLLSHRPLGVITYLWYVIYTSVFSPKHVSLEAQTLM